MSETITTPQETAKQEFKSGLDRLSSDSLFNDTPETKKDELTEVVGGSTVPNSTPIIAEKTTEKPLEETPSLTEQETLKTEAKALGLAETATKEEIEAAKLSKPADVVKPIEEGFKEEEAVALSSEEGTWKSYLEQNNIPIPEDFSEDTGFEVVLKAKEAEIENKYKEQLEIKAEDLLSPYPPEARLIMDLLASGQSLDEIQKPFIQIQQWKSMPKEELVRADLSARQGWTPEMVDHKMEELLTADGNKLDIEYQILMTGINNYEKTITEQRTIQLQQYTQSQNQLKEQKKAQDFNAFKTALDRMPTFMDRKLAAENKQSIVNDYNNGAFERLMQNPVEKAEFMLYKKYGKQALKYAQDRAIEQATLEKAKSQHNVPPVITGNSNVVNTTSNSGKSAIDKLEDFFPTS